jgi:hypothetical protein
MVHVQKVSYVSEKRKIEEDCLKYARGEEVQWLKSKLKLGLWQRLKLKINGKVFVGYAKREGWKGKLPFYIVRCKKHSIYFLDYPHGFDPYFTCPLCIKNM